MGFSAINVDALRKGMILSENTATHLLDKGRFLEVTKVAKQKNGRNVTFKEFHQFEEGETKTTIYSYTKDTVLPDFNLVRWITRKKK